MKIVLLGFMGCGKSTIGKLLSDKISLNFIDLDEFIEKKEKKSIMEIFSDQGEKFFREKEKKYLQVAMRKRNTVIAAGGGTPCFLNNMDFINKNSVSIYLKTSAKELHKRLSVKEKIRPLLMKNRSGLLKFIRGKLKEREKYYMKANHVIKAGKKNEKQTVREIKFLLTKFHSR